MNNLEMALVDMRNRLPESVWNFGNLPGQISHKIIHDARNSCDVDKEGCWQKIPIDGYASRGYNSARL